MWIGDVLIRGSAVGTDTYEINRNLVLTDGARADSVPNLEIETGEIVGAGHASATGRFDDEQLFYLQARGIPADEARRLVVRGFFAELLAAHRRPGPVASGCSRQSTQSWSDQRREQRERHLPAGLPAGRPGRGRGRPGWSSTASPCAWSATEGEVYAISDVCSHADVSLSEGEVEDCTIECWLHGSRFDLAPATRPGCRPPSRSPSTP